MRPERGRGAGRGRNWRAAGGLVSVADLGAVAPSLRFQPRRRPSGQPAAAAL